MIKPEPGTYPSYYDGFLVDLPNEIIPYLEEQKKVYLKTVTHLDDDQYAFAYEKGKWSLAQVMQHINDVERIFAYRALCVSRGEKQNLNGFDQNEYIRPHKEIKVSQLINEFSSLRDSNIYFCQGLSADQWMLKGKASGFEFQMSAFIYAMAGHLDHHLNIINSRYLIS